MDGPELRRQDGHLKVLLLGPNGQVGWELRRALAPLASVVAADRGSEGGLPADLEQLDALRQTVRQCRPDLIVNAAAYTGVDAAEKEPDRARLINTLAPCALAEEAANLNALLVHYSTDYVFDGSGSEPWREDDPVAPLSVYGRTKLEGEDLIRGSGCRHLILRTCWVYAARGRNFLRTMLRLAQERDELSVVDDQIGCPTGAELIADVTAHAIRKMEARDLPSGIWHLSAGGSTSWHGYAAYAIETARAMGFPIRVNAGAITRCSTSDFPTPARRPQNSRLSTVKLRNDFGIDLPDWKDGVHRTLTELCKP
jgi:dTDP-4-dehydrorhamnose reductase